MSTTAGASGSWELRGDLVCALCGRTAATVQGPRAARFVPSKIWIRNAEHAAAVRRLRCPHCGGHLSLEDPREVLVDHHPVSGGDEQPRRRRRLAAW